jgi:glycerol-3-phosphate acyltransferase PlsX
VRFTRARCSAGPTRASVCSATARKRDIYAAKADVIVADGFVGNVAIKMAEATADFMFRNLRDEIPKTTRGKIGGMLIRRDVQRLRDRIDWREFGGAPLLGIDGVAVIAHGRSDARAIKNAIRVTKEAVENQLVSKIRAEVGKS